MTLLDVALDCIRRGWYVFPCVPKSKEPLGGLVRRGYLDASNDEDTIRRWWTAKPDANVAIACGASNLTVPDCDHGCASEAEVLAWLERAREKLPVTYAVLTGRRVMKDGSGRPEYGVQLYYSTAIPGSGHFDIEGGSGDVQSIGDYVMAAGSIHPDSGEAYRVLIDAPVAPLPEWVKQIAPQRRAQSEVVTVDDATADEWKTWLLEYAAHYQIELRDFEKRAPNGWWVGIKCPWEHHSGEGAESSTALGILDGKIAFKCSHGTCEAAKRDTAVFKAEMLRLRGDYVPEPGADPVALLGKPREKPVISDWRELFHTKDEVLNCPPPTFLIDQFLQRQAICAIAAPVGQRKSIIALNVARSLTTKEPLFGVLPVLNQPSRVLYLCPEMGLVSLSERVRKIGVGDCIGDTLFVRSMNLGNLDLIDIPDAALDGSVLIVDTAIRFMSGDENSAKDTKGFSDILFNLQRRQGQDGAIVVLYHSPKATKDASELTLENCMRGSGELGAAITDAHGTRLQDASDGWTSESYIRHIKVRDYPGLEDFNVHCERETGVLVKTGDAGVKAVLSVNRGGYKSNLDGMDDAAKALIKANATITVKALIKLLADNGIERGKTWVSDTRSEIRGCGAKRTE